MGAAGQQVGEGLISLAKNRRPGLQNQADAHPVLTVANQMPVGTLQAEHVIDSDNGTPLTEPPQMILNTEVNMTAYVTFLHFSYKNIPANQKLPCPYHT